jgi:hypothetical protein
MAQKNFGVCQKYNYIIRRERKSVTNDIYRSIKIIYNIKEKNCEDCEDNEETVEEEAGYDLSTT